MLTLLISLLCWIPADGVCNDTSVKISKINNLTSVGAPFRLRCEFTCLSPQHVAQMWEKSMLKDSVALINITSTQPNVTMELNINLRTNYHTGNYYCMTQPPDTISPTISINVSGNPITSSNPTSSLQLNGAPGLLSQMWYWMIIGKTITFLIMFAFLAVKYRKG